MLKTFTKDGVEFVGEMPKKALASYVEEEKQTALATINEEKAVLQRELAALKGAQVTPPPPYGDVNKGMTRKEREEADTQSKMAIYKAVVAIWNKDDAMKKTLLVENTGGGANLLTPELYGEIQMLVEATGVAPKELFTLIQKGTHSIKIPLLTVDPIVYIAGEAISITESDVNFTAEITQLYTLGVITALTEELIQDTTPLSLVNKIIDRMAYKVAQKIDSLAFNGDGTGKFPGIIPNVDLVNRAITASGTGFRSVAYDDVVMLPALIDNAGLENGKYYMTNKMFTYLFLQKDDDHRPIWQMSAMDNDLFTAGGKRQRNLNGYPVVIVNAMPGQGALANEAGKCAILFGDLQQAHVMGWDPAVEVFEGREATVGAANAFTDHLRLLRFTQRVGMAPLFPQVTSAVFTKAS